MEKTGLFPPWPRHKTGDRSALLLWQILEPYSTCLGALLDFCSFFLSFPFTMIWHLNRVTVFNSSSFGCHDINLFNSLWPLVSSLLWSLAWHSIWFLSPSYTTIVLHFPIAHRLCAWYLHPNFQNGCIKETIPDGQGLFSPSNQSWTRGLWYIPTLFSHGGWLAYTKSLWGWFPIQRFTLIRCGSSFWSDREAIRRSTWPTGTASIFSIPITSKPSFRAPQT